MKCENCHYEVNGPAVVEGNFIFHTTCIDDYRRHIKGLNHQCPKCFTTGKMNEPCGLMEAKEVSLAYGEGSECGYSGCMGCHYCRNNVKSIRVPVQVTCNLCDGEGWLTKEPTPITKVVDWKKGT